MSIQSSNNEVLRYPDGRTVTLLSQGRDVEGEYLRVEHRMNKQGPINGPHWHPVLSEMFTIKQGTMRFKVDGEEIMLGPDESLTVAPGQIHQFWNESEGPLVMIHEIRPPGLHWHMFALIHKLETEGKVNKSGIPRNPLWLGLAWEAIDGYLAGPPRIVQVIVLGGLARLAKLLGYQLKV